jgi:hypothetical protein
VVLVFVDQEIVVRAYHGDVVVNADERIVEARLQACGSSRYLLGQVVR